MRLTTEEWAVAGIVCTKRQLEALDCWRRGMGYKRIGLVLGKDPSTVRELVQRGTRRIVEALEKEAA